MATVTRILGSFDNGNCRFEYDYDDSTLRVSAFRCVNNTSQPAEGFLVRDSDGLVYSQVFLANRTTFIAIPTQSPQTRLGLSLDARGRPVGVTAMLGWPAA